MAEQYKNTIKKEASPAFDYIIGTYQRQSFSLMLDSIANAKKSKCLRRTPYIFLVRTITRLAHFDPLFPSFMAATTFAPTA